MLSSLERKVPPVPVMLLCALSIWAWARFPIQTFNPNSMTHVVALILAFMGISIMLTAVVQFRRAKTTLNPVGVENASTLVSGGIFRLSRNPMYLGMAILLLAVAAWNSVVGGVVVVVLFVTYITIFQIRPEERALQAKFGVAYAKYKSEVRRWI